MSETKITDKDIKGALVSLANAFAQELFDKTEGQLEGYWHYKYDSEASFEWNMYKFHDALGRYSGFCRRWEEKKHGSCCVVERVRDKYIMLKIRWFIENYIEEPHDDLS